MLANCHGGGNEVKRIQDAECLRKWYFPHLGILFSISIPL